MMDALAQRLKDLEAFLPPRSFEAVLPFFRKYAIGLTITRERRTRLGDYRAPAAGEKNHRISVNGNLNPYAFLITLLHEIAHLLVYEKYQHRVKSHGAEWKSTFGALLIQFADRGIFPENLEAVVRNSALSPASATFRDVALSGALRRYDRGEDPLLAGDLAVGDFFTATNKLIYEVLERRRSRLRCRRMQDGREYLVPFAARVEIIQSASQNGRVT